ncbi:MAG: hypothetical protein CME72_01035 [Halomonadaceae bacterium]|nr:hypothetical protein [Halomonadaceae bacterium]
MTVTARSLLAINLDPKRQLQTLWTHEQAEGQRYHRVASDFLPLDAATCRLLTVLGTECDARLAWLESLAGSMDMLTPQCEQEHSGEAISLADGDEPISAARRQFSKTIAAAKRAQQFYEAMCEFNATLLLQPFLHDGLHQKRAEHRLLLEHFETLRLSTSMPLSPTS